MLPPTTFPRSERLLHMTDTRFPAQRVYNYPYGGQQPYSDDAANQAPHQVMVGAPPPARLADEPQFSNFQQVPAFYTIPIILGGEPGETEGGSVPLRPEAFILERITWCCNEAPLDYADPTGGALQGVAIGGSPQGRAVTVTWGDEFTRFLNRTPCLISALFGDSQGFLELKRGILFQGRQVLSANLARISDPTGLAAAQLTPPTLNFHFNFQGVGLLPKNVAQSGSAG